MANKSFRYFLKGIELRGETVDPSDAIEGSVWSNSTSNRFKGYIQAAIREFVTTDQAQTLSNKTLIVANNTITTAPNGNLTSTELNAALNELQLDIDNRALSSTVTAHTSASTGVHGVTGAVVGTTDTQTLTNKSLVDSTTKIVGSADATKKFVFENNPAATNTTLTLQASQTADRVITFPDSSDVLVGLGTPQTLTNKTLTNPTISQINNGGAVTIPAGPTTLVGTNSTQSLTNKSLVDSSTAIVDATDSTKQIKFDAVGTTATSTTIASSQTANRTITLPDISGTVITTGDTGTVTSTMIADGTIVNADINASAAIAKSKLAAGTASALQANDGSGVISDVTDITVGTNNLTLAATKHLEMVAVTDSTTTGSNASLTAFVGSSIRLTNGSLVSIANIPAGAEGQELAIFNRTGVDVTVVDESGAVGTAANRIYTGTSGNITFPKNGAFFLRYDSTSARWQIVGGTGSGSGTSLPVDSLVQQQFDNAALTDFTQTGLALTTVNPIKGAKSALLTHQPATSQSFKQTIAVDRKFRGYNTTLSLVVRSSAASANLTILVTDETNSATLLSSSQITTGQITSAVFNTASSTTVTVTDRAILNQIKVGASITGSGIPANTVVTAVNSSAGTITISNAATATATGVALKVSVLPATQRFSFAIPANCASLSYTVTALQEAGSPESYIDDVQIYLAQTANSSYSLTQTTFNATDWAPYTPTLTGFGTPTGVEFEWRQVGANYEIRGKFTAGTTTATEARISLPNGAISASASIIPSLSIIGYGGYVSNGATIAPTVLIEPSVNYMTFGYSQGTTASLNKQNGSSIISSGQTFSFFATVPIAGLTANTTTTNTIPLTSSVLVTQPDSMLNVNTLTIGTGSTNTGVLYFSAYSVNQSQGDAFTITNDSVLGSYITIQKEGLHRFRLQLNPNATQRTYYITKNSTTLTATNLTSTTQILVSKYTEASAQDSFTIESESYCSVGDVIRFQINAALNLESNSILQSGLLVSYQGSTKILNPSSDQKIAIPTHQLRFEGASARGSTDTAIVKFDTQTITQGDGFTVVNTAANGTVVTMRKAGKLSVDATIFTTSSAYAFSITKNITNPTSYSIDSTYIQEVQGGAGNIQTLSKTFDVVVGDVIRIAGQGAPTSRVTNQLSLSLQETSVAVALQNVTPTYDNSDSAIRVNTANGFGSSSTMIRRFSNTVDNFGTDISYVDSATDGASFTVNKDGEYQISYSDSFSAGNTFAITRNLVTPVTTSINSLSVGNILAVETTSSANTHGNISWQGYLLKGDIIRPHGNSQAVGTTNLTQFTISRVGKTSGTVDVTPFVQIPTQDVEAIEALTTTTFGSTNTGVPVLNITKNTNKGIIQVISDSASGTSFKVLKDCELKISASAGATGLSNIYITKNATNLLLSPDNIEMRTTCVSGYYNPISASFTVSANDIVRIQRDSTNITSIYYLTLTATAISNSIASSTQQVSSDTMSFVFKSTAIDPNTDAIGTFNTYTLGASNNTKTIATSAPSQNSSDMNVNGIQVFARAFTSATTSAQPAIVDVFIGKGLKSVSLAGYGSSSKTNAVTLDNRYIGATDQRGLMWVYNESTGILTLNAGTIENGTGTRYFLTPDLVSSYNSAYITVNASKAPSLVTVPQLQQRIAYISEQRASGTNGGSSVAATWTTRTLNTLVDNTGIVTSLSANTITLAAGTYRISAQAPLYASNAVKIRLRNTTDSITMATGGSYYSAAADSVTATATLDAEFTITSAKSFQIQYYASAAATSTGLGVSTASGEVEIYTQVEITKIK